MVELNWFGEVSETHYSKIVYKLVQMMSDQISYFIKQELQKN